MSRTVAVLGARDSGAAELVESLGPAAARAGLVVVTAARPDHRPDVAVLAVDAVCPIRPDDLEVARGVAARVPLVVVLTGARGRDGLAATLETTARRLAANGVPGPVVVAADPLLGAGDSPADGVRRLDAEDLVALLDPARLPAVTAPAEAPASEAADPGRAARETADWLAARRTEVVSSRSSALRQDAQALRLDVVQDLHRGLREVGARARDEIGAARRSALPGVLDELAADADEVAARAVARADRLAAALVARHLGAGAPDAPAVAAPAGALRPSTAPRHRGEDALMLVMGAAGGTGVGRMVLTPLADVPGIAPVLLPLAIVAGLALGWTTVEVRRTQTLRAHMIAVTTDQLAGLHAETEQALGARVLAAESVITDGFAHDPGPRVADLERRLRRLRLPADRHTNQATPAVGSSPR